MAGGANDAVSFSASAGAIVKPGAMERVARSARNQRPNSANGAAADSAADFAADFVEPACAERLLAKRRPPRSASPLPTRRGPPDGLSSIR